MRKTLAAAAAVVLLTTPLPAAEPVPGEPKLSTTLQLPTFGISIDAEGELAVKEHVALDPRLILAKVDAMRRALPADVRRVSPLRKVSLRRLEQELLRREAAGLERGEVLEQLAGLTEVRFVVVDVAGGDVIVMGPAEPWIGDPAGRRRGIVSGRPTLRLEDLCVALVVFAPGVRPPVVGCTIDPDPRGLAKLTEFQKQVPRVVRQNERLLVARRIYAGTQESLGNANIRVFGVSPRTHLAQVLVEADYRMKRIGIGLEEPPIRMVTFWSALRTAQHGMLQRWWFTPNYAALRTDPARTVMALAGPGVQLQGEDKAILPGGALRIAGGRANPASALFTTAFTKKYPEIAAASPVYAELKQMVDWLILGAWLRKRDAWGRTGWDAAGLRDEHLVPFARFDAPRTTPCVVNVAWKGNRLFAPAGGGVTIDPTETLELEQIAVEAEDLTEAKKAAAPLGDGWWWDS